MEKRSNNPQVFQKNLLIQVAQQIYRKWTNRMLLGGSVAPLSVSTKCNMHSENVFYFFVASFFLSSSRNIDLMTNAYSIFNKHSFNPISKGFP